MSPIVRIVLALCAVCIFAAPAAAHPPSDLILSYDPVSGTLQATFTHQVADPATHYVRSVVIVAGGVTLVNGTYLSQPSSSTFTYDYPVQVPVGTEITVTGVCSISGRTSRTLVAGESPTTPAAPGWTLPLAFLALGGAGIVAYRRRHR